MDKFFRKGASIYNESMSDKEIEDLKIKLENKKNIGREEIVNSDDILNEFLDGKKNLKQESKYLNNEEGKKVIEFLIKEESKKEYKLKKDKEAENLKLMRSLSDIDHKDEKIKNLVRDILKYEEEIKILSNENGLLPTIKEENRIKVLNLSEKIEKNKLVINNIIKIQDEMDLIKKEGIIATYEQESDARIKSKEKELQEKIKRN